MHSIHHVAVTASNFEVSLQFYLDLGFETLIRLDQPEKHKRIALLQLGNFKLELFWYDDLTDHPMSRDTIGNNVHDVGVKHFAIRVNSIQETYGELAGKGILPATKPERSDNGYDFFFIRDPDGIWIEYVQDDTYS